MFLLGQVHDELAERARPHCIDWLEVSSGRFTPLLCRTEAAITSQKHHEEAIHWFNTAAKEGHEGAAAKLQQLKARGKVDANTLLAQSGNEQMERYEFVSTQCLDRDL